MASCPLDRGLPQTVRRRGATQISIVPSWKWQASMLTHRLSSKLIRPRQSGLKSADSAWRQSSCWCVPERLFSKISNARRDRSVNPLRLLIGINGDNVYFLASS